MGAQSQRWVVDEIEEQTASIELAGGKMISVPLAILPAGVKSGDVLRATIEIDAHATSQALADSAAQVKRGSDASRRRDPGGDVVL
jgi:hypothetical protein